MKKWPYLTAMAIFATLYVVGQFFVEWERLTNVVTTVLAIIAAVAFWMELKSNDRLNEGKFIIDLNNQFITNPQLSEVEWELEKYYARYNEAIKKSEDISKIQFDYGF